MKKNILLTICMLIIINIVMPVANAAPPVPNLSNIKITHIGNNVSGSMFAPADFDNTIYGNAILLRVRYAGCPNFTSTFFYQNNTLIGQVNKFESGSQYIADGSGIITGYIKTYIIPSSSLPGNKFGYLGDFLVKAAGIRGGNFSAGVHDIILR